MSFATQDHWHALQTIWACQAGKDVYVEKPATHDLWEGRKMVEAARKYQRMVQIGTQNRSSPNVMEGIRRLKEGVIGKVYMARGMSYKLRGNLGKHRPRPVPPGPRTGTPGLARPRWSTTAVSIITAGTGSRTSPAATSPTRPRTTSTSSAGDSGWTPIPNLMMSLGGRYLPAEDDDADTPNCQSLVCQWDGRNVQATFEIRHWFTNGEAGMGGKYPFLDGGSVVGVIFFGSEGYMIIPDYSSYYVFLGAGRELGPHAAPTKPQRPRHCRHSEVPSWTCPTSRTGSPPAAAASTRT